MGLSQWFAAAWEYDVASSEDLSRIINGLGNLKAYVFKVRATGVKGDSRSYGNVVLVRGGDPSNWGGLIYDLYRYLGTARDVTHVVYELMERGSGKYFVSIRAVLTEDFMTADVARMPQDTLMGGIAQEILGSDERVAAVGYDVTPKPPATIEYE